MYDVIRCYRRLHFCSSLLILESQYHQVLTDARRLIFHNNKLVCLTEKSSCSCDIKVLSGKKQNPAGIITF